MPLTPNKETATLDPGGLTSAPASSRSSLVGIIRLLRPHHWTKNVFCFAGVVFGGFTHDAGDWLKAAQVFLVFCLSASTVYVWNDIFDRDRDRLHPVKRLRPLPSGQVSVPAAVVLGLVLIVGAIAGAWFLVAASQVCLVIYFAINIAYTLYFKHVPLLDIGCIASGFILRLLAGIYPMDTPTAWIALLTMGLALLLATAKRRSELARMDGGEVSQRPVLRGYTLPLLDSLIDSTATATVLFYALFTVLSDKNPTLVLTVPVVYYGIMRYKSLVMIRGGGEEPEMISAFRPRLFSGWPSTSPSSGSSRTGSVDR
jgi:4-hydroxybenzoate polyprenyltransferase